MHKLLQRQIRKHLSNISEEQKRDMKDFLCAIEDAYSAHEEDRHMLERSLDISSEEMLEKNQRIQEKSEEHKKIIDNLCLEC